MRILKNILVSGGAGFIGVNFIKHLFQQKDFKGKVINVDKLTYAGNLESLKDIGDHYSGTRYFFEKQDICDLQEMKRIMSQYEIDTVIHFAAESHVDRSILGPDAFIQTNILGTFHLLEAAKSFWKDKAGVLFHHVSTDEVYGSLGETGYFYEDTPYDPRSPYSASKASSDHLVMSYYHTYKLPVTLSNCSNNYGPYQFPEKLIPLIIMNALNGKELPIYGDGKNIRDWLYVNDHARGILDIIRTGELGQKYNIGGENERPNIEIVNLICDILAKKMDKSPGFYQKQIRYVEDRLGHDRRYAINCDKIKKELGWAQSVSFEQGLEETISWYLNNQDWIKNVQSGEYQKWIKQNYSDRDEKSAIS